MWWMFARVATAQVLLNPEFDATTPTEIPNTQNMPGWTLLDGADVAEDGVEIDCADILTASANGGQFLRATSDGIVAQGASTIVSGLIPNVAYRVRFETALVRHFGQSTGHWQVTFALVPVQAPDITLPAGNPAQTAWRTQTVGPFPNPAGTEQVLEFRVVTNADGNTTSPDLPGKKECEYDSEEGTADLLLDNVVLIPDTDGDGLFDDEEELFGTDPAVADTDVDGLNDYDELFVHETDPLDDDSDDDTVLDGTELLLYSNPLAADTDEDGLDDGVEVGIGTSPILDDTDADGFLDGEEVDAGTDPLDPKSFPVDPGTTPTGPTDTADTGAGDSSDTGIKVEDGGCSCAAAPASGSGLVALLLMLVRARRRS